MRMGTGRIDAGFQQLTSMRTASELRIDDFSFRCCELTSLLSFLGGYSCQFRLSQMGELRFYRWQLCFPLRHWMRHTHATHALERGVDLTTVRDNLRHASLSTTSTYLHTDEEKRARQLGAAFAGPRCQSPCARMSEKKSALGLHPPTKTVSTVSGLKCVKTMILSHHLLIFNTWVAAGRAKFGVILRISARLRAALRSRIWLASSLHETSSTQCKCFQCPSELGPGAPCLAP